MKLIHPNIKYLDSYTESFSDGFSIGCCDDTVEFIKNKFAQHVKNITTLRTTWNDGGLRNDMPYQRLWLVKDDKFIGNVILRKDMNDFHHIMGGNGGYHIRNSEQGKGYGTVALSLMIEKFKEMGLKKAMITCNDGNIGSAKVIEKNGGFLADKINVSWCDYTICRYEIAL